MGGDHRLDLRDRHPGSLAMLARLATAQEVRVHDAASVLHRVEVEARAAVRTPQEPLQRVVVDALASASATLVDEHVLDPVEQLLADQWLVPAVVLFALEDDSAEIPPVAEQSADGFDGHRPTVGHVFPRASPQPRLGHGALKVLEAVAPCCVELEHCDDEGRSFGIDGDCPHFAAVDPLPHVEIPERGNAGDASTRCLRGHLVGDIRSRCAGLVLVDAVEDRGHQVADVAVFDVIHDRDQLHAELPKLSAGDRRVGGVAMHARAGVDDDRVHVLAVPDSRHHLLELRSPINRHRGSTWLDVLLDHFHPELFGFPQARLALRWDGVPLGVIVGVDLAAGGHSQVQHRSLLLAGFAPELSAFRSSSSVRPATGSDSSSRSAIARAASTSVAASDRTSNSSRSSPTTRILMSPAPMAVTARHRGSGGLMPP
nr:hypothetical protein [Glycomyces albidus]